MFRRRNPRYFRVGLGPRKAKIGERVIDTITPDRAEVKVGGPLVHAKVEWDREKKERIRQLRKRMNA